MPLKCWIAWFQWNNCHFAQDIQFDSSQSTTTPAVYDPNYERSAETPPTNNTSGYIKEQTNKRKGFNTIKNEVLINEEDQSSGI